MGFPRFRARHAATAASLAIGLAIGMGAFTFVYAKGYSYLTNDPAACANCHIMREHFDAWNHSSHRAVAGCNDCHTPHDAVGKYVVKARNGFWHSFYFTTGRFPDPLRITPANHEVTEGACRYCHQAIVDAIEPAPSHVRAANAPGFANEGADRRAVAHANTETSCVRCHTYVGHWVR